MPLVVAATLLSAVACTAAHKSVSIAFERWSVALPCHREITITASAVGATRTYGMDEAHQVVDSLTPSGLCEVSQSTQTPGPSR